MTMKYSNVYINSIAYELPTHVIYSDELEERLKPVYKKLHIPEGQLESWTGIEERRWWPEGYAVSDGAAAAGRTALNIAGFNPKDLEMLLYTGVCRDHFEPATACHVAAKMGIKSDMLIFDISNACLGVLNGIVEIANRIELGQIRAGLVVSCETAREINEISIRHLLKNPDMELFKYVIATLTGGSGAIGVLVTDTPLSNSPKRRVLGGVVHSDVRYHNLCRWGVELQQDYATAIPFMETDSVEVMNNGIKLGQRTWHSFLRAMNWEPSDLDVSICHQVGAPHRDAVLKALKIPPEKDFPTFPFLGNIGTVSLPISAAIAEERHFLQPGHRTGLMGIGSGLNCMILGVEW